MNSPGSQPSEPPPHISVFDAARGHREAGGELPRRAELERGAERVADRRADERAGDPVGAVHACSQVATSLSLPVDGEVGAFFPERVQLRGSDGDDEVSVSG